MRKHELVALLGADGPLGESLRALGVPVYIEPCLEDLRTADGPFWHPTAWRYAWRVARHLRREQVDILYANSAAAAYLGGLAMWARGKVIWRLHRPLEAPSLHLNLLCANLLWQIHVPFPAMRDSLRLLVGDRPRIHVAPYGIAMLPAAPARRKSDKPPVIGMYGSWAPDHGQDVLARAYRLLQENGQRAELHLAGPARAEAGERFRAMVTSGIRAAGCEDRLHVEEQVTDVAAFFANCDVVVVPSLHEGSTRKAMEACAIGRPVVASRAIGMAEIIEDGRTGLLVPSHHPRGLADALALLLASPALRAEMGRQARIRMEERFSLDAMLDAFEATLAEEALAAS